MKIILTISVVTFMIATLAMTHAKKNKVIFFGDSITQMGIDKGGYIDRLKNDLQKKGLQDKFELLGAGIGGNKIYDLYLRMPEDVLDKKPNTVVIWEGVNDVWHKSWGTGTDLDKYEKFYVAIIKKLQAQKIQVIVTTPAVIGEKHDGTNTQDKDLDAYSDVIRKLSKEYNCKLVDLRRIFMQYEKEHNPENKESGILTTDKVHLNEVGNQLVADEMLSALIN
ncbi:SGNH/GDSL hydrolase family protein [Ferruginibacter sp. HRS2-29]|uniref:SGNH/GDSL hydrolase family protein n=1 Tax=Ferruginibacter sp. HRS2-29 TaxID=2487334 RepID=UPI0020CEC47A|nr:SGNH/GDSL hydrolase family protein [Ferruginibacter sp. HRS2-29]MCP9749631.1 G-D-S-L family lipolytic protein [Ferruginibacter sp. HRS2-29]